jgi:hypothetical protein
MFNHLDLYPLSDDHIRREIITSVTAAKKAMDKDPNVFIGEQLMWVFAWDEGGAAIGEELQALGKKVLDEIEKDESRFEWRKGKLFVKQNQRKTPVPSSGSLPVPPPPPPPPGRANVRRASSPLTPTPDSPPPAKTKGKGVQNSARKRTGGRNRTKQTPRKSTGGVAPRKNLSLASIRRPEALLVAVDDMAISPPLRPITTLRPRSSSLSGMENKSNLVSFCLL